MLAQCVDSSQSPVGVWRLVELTNYENDEPSHPFGEEPSGTFIYTPKGHLSIQIMRTPAAAPFESRPSDEALGGVARAYIAYYGGYTVDCERGIISHEFEGSLNPNYVGTFQERPYEIDGDVLTIDSGDLGGRRFVRQLVRVEGLE